MSINPSQNCLVKKVFPMKFLSARCNKIASQLQLLSWFTLGKSRKQIFIFVNRRTMNHNVKHLHFSKIVMYLVVFTKSEVGLILSLCFLFLVLLISVDAMCHQQIASIIAALGPSHHQWSRFARGYPLVSHLLSLQSSSRFLQQI